MFYGVDTTERAKAGSIPTKTKYKPWSGAPMAGELELDWDGRTIILERTSLGRSPMGQFRAYEKDSGLSIPELTSENCGRVLLGVERSVFERSAFVRQLGLAVSADDALEKRLASLVTTGEETVSAAETARRLRDRKNRLRHNKTGLIPEANAQLAAVEASLAQHHLAAQQQQTLRARQQELAVRRAELLDIQAGLTILDNQKKLQQKTNAKAALIDANNRLAGAQARTAKLPPRETLDDLQNRIRAIASMELPPAPPEPPPAPDCPEAFRGVPEERLLEQAARDGREFDRLTALRRRPVILDVLAFVLFTAAAVIFGVFLKNLPLCAVCAALALAGAVKFVFDRRHNRQYEANMDAAQALLGALRAAQPRRIYHAAPPSTAARLAAWRQSCEQLSHAAAQRQRLLDEKNRQTAQLIGSAAMLAPDVQTLDDAARAVAAALAAWSGSGCGGRLRRARAGAVRRRQRRPGRRAASSRCPRATSPRTRPLSVRAELLRTEMEGASVQSRLDQNRGALAALGDPAALAAEQEQLTARIRALEEQYTAVELAEAAIQDAAAEMQRRFAPALTEETGKLFSALTGGKYDRMLLDRQMDVMAGETAEPALRPGGYLSAGTQDALYLALRLAVCRLALPGGDAGRARRRARLLRRHAPPPRAGRAAIRGADTADPFAHLPEPRRAHPASITKISGKQAFSGDFMFYRTPRCSSRIFTPSRIRMMPPAISALLLYFRPNTLPTFRPTADRINVVAPMKLTAAGRFTSGRSANVMPTASASMLVATASTSIVLNENELLRSSGVVLAQALAQHVPTDERQQHECDPMIDRRDVGFKRRAKEIADRRHEGLKAAEPESDDQIMLPRQLLRGKPLTDRNGEGVHRQPHREQK